MNQISSCCLRARAFVAATLAVCMWLPGAEAFASEPWTLEWEVPTRFTNGKTLPSDAVTGYRVYKKTSEGFRLFSTTKDTRLEVPEGTYAVAATFGGGQTGLSTPATFPNWEDVLAVPDESNTVTPAMDRTVIQAKVSAMKPGDVLYLRGGKYSFSQGGNVIEADASGERGRYVTIRNYPGEVPVITGVGWEDETQGPVRDQTLLKISGDYVRVYGLKVTRSGKFGIIINGSHCWIEECESYSNWQTNIRGGVDSQPGRHVNGGTIIYCKAHHSRRGGGIGIGLDNREDYNADGWTMKRNLSYRNGFNDDNQINPWGGGNSDGTGCTKYAHDNYAFDFDIEANGRANRIHDYHVVENLLFFNADDGADVSSGEGTLFSGNVSAANGPSGTKGYKQLRGSYEAHRYAGNVSIGSRKTIFPSNTLYIEMTSDTPIKAGDEIKGFRTDASATVDSGFMFLNTNSAQEWKSGKLGVLYLTGVSGSFQSRESIMVNGVQVARVSSLGQSVGCDHRVNTKEGTPMGRNDEIGWTALFHNPPGEGSLRGLSSSTSPERGGDAINNLSYFNQDNDILTGFTEAENFKNLSSVAPDIANPDYEFEEPVLKGGRIREQWANLYREVQANLMPVKGGNLHGKGQLAQAYYHPTPADDPEAPSDPDDHTKLHWFRFGKLTPAPDIGAVQYQEIFPPLVLPRSPVPGSATPPVPDKLPAPVFKAVVPVE